MSRIHPELRKALDGALQHAIQQHALGDSAGAEALYNKVLDFDPSHPVALHNLGLIRMQSGDLERALLMLDEAVTRNPGEAVFNYNYATALQQDTRLLDAVDYYTRAVSLRPDYREAWENIGVAFQDLERFDEAKHAYEEALALDHCSPVARKNLANVYRVTGDIASALECYRQRIKCAPLDADVVLQYGTTFLSEADFANGWQYYEWRHWSPDFLEFSNPYRVPLPKWDGSSLRFKSLLAYGEQGIGDEIMFASCLPDVSRQAKHTVLLCDPRLVSLFSRSFRDVQVEPKDRANSTCLHLRESCRCDVRISTSSLPRYFRQKASAFPDKHFLVADAIAVATWRKELEKSGDTLKVGISWRGGSTERAKQARSIDLSRFKQLFQHQNVTFINVQYGLHDEEIESFNGSVTSPLVSFVESDPLKNMDDFASLLSALDLVISVDSSTVHLAGALGVPTWLLLPRHADWRWTRKREDSLWYSSVRLFWQKEPGSSAWTEVIGRVNHELSCLTRHRTPGNSETSLNQCYELDARTTDSVTRETDRVPATLLNDTSSWYHWGCSCTSIAVHNGLHAAGLSVHSVAITTFNKLSPLPKSIEDFDSQDTLNQFTNRNRELIAALMSSDVVVINGEGTLHGLNQAAVALLYTAYVAKRWLGKNTQIINHSCFPIDKDSNEAASGVSDEVYRKVYRELDFVAAREEFSINELSRLGIQATQSFDCLPLFVRERPATATRSSRRVVIAGSVMNSPSLLETMIELADMVTKLGYDVQVLIGSNAYIAHDDVLFVNELHKRLRGHYRLVAAQSESEWLDAIAGADIMISGRFHHTLAAACVGTPFAVTSSNTNKMEGLIERLGVSPDDVWLNASDPGQAKARVKRLLDNPHCALISDEKLRSLEELATNNFRGLATI